MCIYSALAIQPGLSGFMATLSISNDIAQLEGDDSMQATLYIEGMYKDTHSSYLSSLLCKIRIYYRGILVPNHDQHDIMVDNNIIIILGTNCRCKPGKAGVVSR